MSGNNFGNHVSFLVLLFAILVNIDNYYENAQLIVSYLSKIFQRKWIHICIVNVICSDYYTNEIAWEKMKWNSSNGRLKTEC